MWLRSLGRWVLAQALIPLAGALLRRILFKKRMAPVLTPAQEAVRQVIFDVGVDVVVARWTKVIPFLNWPVVNEVFVFAVGKLLEPGFEEFIKHWDGIVIDATTGKEAADAVAAKEKLEALEGSTNAEQVEKAREEFRAAYRELIRIRRTN